MESSLQFVAATPVLASLDIERSVAFFMNKLGFERIHATQGTYGIVARGPVEIHFWACTDRKIAEATGCRIRIRGIRELFEQCSEHGIVHPNASLRNTEWETSEFAVLDPDGNIVTFYEERDA